MKLLFIEIEINFIVQGDNENKKQASPSLCLLITESTLRQIFFDLSFQNYCTYHCIYVKNLMLNTHCHPMISTHFNFLTLGCGVSFNQGYINVEFDVMSIQL